LSAKLPVGLLLLVFASSVSADVIHIAELDGKTTEFRVTRDLFSMRVSETGPATVDTAPAEPAPSSRVPKAQNVKREVLDSVFFEGYVMKRDHVHALLSVNGEYFVVAEGEVVADIVKVIEIDRDRVIIEVEGQRITVGLKGDGNESP